MLPENDTLGPRYDLTCWYINMRRAAELLGNEAGIAVPLKQLSFVEYQHVMVRLKRAFVDWLRITRPRTLGQLLLAGPVASGTFFTHYSDFYCKRITRGSDNGSIHCYSKLEPFSMDRVEVTLREEHLTSSSAPVMLSGRTQLFLLAAVGSVRDRTIVGIPYLVATLLTDLAVSAPIGSRWPSRLEVFVDMVDSFALIRQERSRRTTSELQALRTVPELDVKRAFAEIVDEPTIPKDWAGERSDLYSTQVTLGGSRISTALAFKGPSRFAPMTLAALGKNGDQIDRLFSEPADLLVLQHCHTITSPVRNAMRAYASQIHNPRLFMLIDGHDTLRVLRAYGKLGFAPTGSREAEKT